MQIQIGLGEEEVSVEVGYCGRSNKLLTLKLPLKTNNFSWYTFEISSEKTITFLESKEAEPLILSWLFFFTMCLLYFLT